MCSELNKQSRALTLIKYYYIEYIVMQEGRIYEYGTSEFKFTVNESILLVDICRGDFFPPQKMVKSFFG